jgi:predicted nucleic acid-binding protein
VVGAAAHRSEEQASYCQIEAAHTRADFLVTGDKDVLEIREETRFAIVSAEAFVSTLGKP